MDDLHFDISEYVRRPDLGLPVAVANKILRYHIWPMNPVRERLGRAITVSLKSGYRPVEHEREKGRDGTSTHTFELTEIDPFGLGAADYTCLRQALAELGQLMIELSEYTRICFYPDHLFFHGDYGFWYPGTREKRLYIDSGKGWKQVGEHEWKSLIESVAGR